MKKLLCCAGLLCVAVATPCFAASPWDGTWKLNEAKSHMTGSTVTITQQGGMYMLDAGVVKYKFACDGKDYVILADRSLSCTGSGNSYTEIVKIAGKPYETTTRMISADGKTMTVTSKGTRPDGTPFTTNDTEVREGAGTGLVGTWKETKVKSSVPSVIELKVNGNVFHWYDPGYKELSDAKLDGTPAPISGGAAPPGLMISNKSDGPMKVASVVTLNGKELGKDIMTLSADGKTITDVSWTPGKESEKQSYVYDKQ
jgi:hypothetical protein